MPARQTRRARAARRRARRVAAADNDLLGWQWSALVAAWGGCAYCGATGTLQRDCVLPISRGGRYTLDNVVPACPTWNASKCHSEVTAWLRRTRRDERAFLTRWVEVRASLAARAADAAEPSGPAVSDPPAKPRQATVTTTRA